MPVCKITTSKTMPDQNLNSGNLQLGQTICPRFTEGQEFIVEKDPGEGFCNWAWKDIRKAYVSLMDGESRPGAQDENTIIVRCRDIVRPVFFKLERLDN